MRAMLVLFLVISVTLILLPRRWTGAVFQPAQVVAPIQGFVRSVTDRAAHFFSDGATVDPAVDVDALARANAAMQHQVIALAARADALERENVALQNTRRFAADGKSIGLQGELIPARVFAGDATTWRSSLLLSAGTGSGVAADQSVTTRHFSIQTGENPGISEGLSVLLGECLIGWIEQTGTHTSRVKLTSDIATQIKVRVGRVVDGGVQLVDGYFWLNGRGKGRMEIRGVDRRMVEGDRPSIFVGDWVVSDPRSESLPASLAIGQIESIAADLKSPLLAVLQVRAAIDERQVDQVYVFRPSESSE